MDIYRQAVRIKEKITKELENREWTWTYVSQKHSSQQYLSELLGSSYASTT